VGVITSVGTLLYDDGDYGDFQPAAHHRCYRIIPLDGRTETCLWFRTIEAGPEHVSVRRTFER